MQKSVYQRPNKPLICKALDFSIKNPLLLSDFVKPKLLSVDASTECHITPQQTALSMVSYLDYQFGQSVCEPHAGTGQLIAALVVDGVPFNKITAIELHYSLCEVLRERFNELQVYQSDFLENKAGFDKIISNPPFKTINKHIDHIQASLNVGGFAICLVPITYKKLCHDVLEILPYDTFIHCRVCTKIIRIYK